jgi:hypothetical protein
MVDLQSGLEDESRSLRMVPLQQGTSEQIAQSLGVKQASVLKMGRQADLYLSTLRRFVEAAGGALELRVEPPGEGVLRLTGTGDITH